MTPIQLLEQKIREIPDFPEPGVVFKDITPLLQDPRSLDLACDLLAAPYRERHVDLVVGIESRGFLFGPAVARQLGAGFAPARKLGKLPWQTVSERYELEYGTSGIEMHRDAISPEQQVLVVDDLIATGGTAAATVKLIRRMGGHVVATCFLIELSFLEGRKALAGVEVEAVLTY